ncbi:MarR family winged helix-turn-helix transcriptional regulator [Aquimarina sp. 2201CG14-23]|uniref:MarR family winged helix-turn-helix transcriptional regulator n=1 Tax=Aquimarina mycalae TaxID=3040073 RepID=UPI002477F6E7|nr:MarR family winged helix-turn-helix transcriptional regulator [Aquimarina sp. 2201CG14-23]MDH7446986.1 MarR family winged helix-turn-helix transcriptional regulator [Aquimarina sp. 2201CG14-23]
MIHKSDFNPNQQQKDISSKIVTGLERISEVFKVLLWEKAKLVGLSPIQIQILIFITFHKQELCNVSHLAKEFNVTKPTISDAIKVLDKKAMIIKDYSSSDNRSYTIQLSELGKEIVSKTSDFTHPLKDQIDHIEQTDLNNLFHSLSELIYKLNRKGILTVQRTCFGCKFYKKTSTADYCNLLEKELLNEDIRLDCPEYEER